MSELKVFTASLANRRRARRCPVSKQCRTECRKGSVGLGKNVAVAALDLSEVGVRLIVRVELARNAAVEVQLTGPGILRPLRRGGKVVWSEPLKEGGYAIGVVFEKPLTYADLHRLAKI